MEYAVTYLRILFCFTFGSVAYNGISSILRSVGDSKSPLYALIVSALANTLLDILFILVFKLGVAGVAYATILSQILSAVLVLIFLLKKRKEIGLTNLVGLWMCDPHYPILLRQMEAKRIRLKKDVKTDPTHASL